MPISISIGILIFPDLQELDAIAPHETLAALPGATVHLVAASRAPITSTHGLVLQPTTTYADCPALDVICVPGGTGINALLADRATLDFLRERAPAARYVTSVCTGAHVLGAAGLLRGKRATTHWGTHDLLAAFGAIPTKGRVVRDGNVITGGGITAGMDFALTLAAELTDRATAEAIQLQFEYAPEPPFDAGTPDIAPPPVLRAVLARNAGMRALREKLVAEAAAALAPA
jgi:cyclohexyl-isocyanide hydratase